MADPAPAADFCPYVGLQPFRVADREYFFGREKEERIISANLFAAPLTVLYGPSAVGKSSVLQAGVVPHLADERRTAVAYFATWQGERYMTDLKAECRRAFAARRPGDIAVDDALPLDEWLTTALTAFGGTLLLMLDQFEEYLLYHREDDKTAFDAELARIVNRTDLGVNVLIGLRDDSLSKLNRFSKRIPNLLGNTLPLRRLTAEAATRAIKGPIEKYNANVPGARPTRIEETLVSEIISDVQIGKIATSAGSGLGGVQAGEDTGRIETAFLQLVLTELWQEADKRGGDRVLDSSTLHALGGADAIVRHHVDREIGKLGLDGQEIAARLFQHLVTPSGAKYALLTADLVELAERPREDVLPVLKALADARLLRRIESSDRYEIFHDAFAEALLDWRKDYLAEKKKRMEATLAEARRQEERVAERRRLRRMALAALVVLTVAGVAIYFIEERRDRNALQSTNEQLNYSLEIAQQNQIRANESLKSAEARQAQAEAAQREAQNFVEAERKRLDAERADLANNQQLAKSLRAEQQVFEQNAAQAKQETKQAAAKAEQYSAAATAAQTRIDDLNQSAMQKGYDLSKISQPVPTALPAPPPQPNAAAPAATTTPPATGGTTPPPSPAPAKGNYKDIYRDAMNAKNAKHWDVAAQLLRQAIAQNGTDSADNITISGFGNIEPYVPHFYLGLALKIAGDCAGALREFDLSEKDGKIQKTNLQKTLLQNRAACGGKQDPPGRLVEGGVS